MSRMIAKVYVPFKLGTYVSFKYNGKTKYGKVTKVDNQYDYEVTDEGREGGETTVYEVCSLLDKMKEVSHGYY